MIGGGMGSGLRISLSGTVDEVSQRGSLVDGSPEKHALDCMNNERIIGVAIPYKDKPTGTIRIDVREHP